MFTIPVVPCFIAMMNPNSLPDTPQLRGYSQLAQFMVRHQHVVLKQYGELAVRDLLYLQAELCDLQYDYAQQAKLDRCEGDVRNRYDREWWYLMSDELRGGEGKQWKLALQIRTKLREYYAAIKQYEEVAAIRRPSEHQRSMVCKFIQGESLGGNCDFLGRDLSDEHRFPSVFNRPNREDLIFIGDNTGEEDLISRAIKGPGFRLGHRLWSALSRWVSTPPTPSSRNGARDVEARGDGTDLDYYPDTKLRFVLDVFGSAISCVIPCISIIVLFFVKDLLQRLYTVCIFSFVFSIFMSLATRARRIEIFGATAAFASVQVVFVGTTNNP